MKAAPIDKHPGFSLMKQSDVQSFYHLQMPRWLFSDARYKAMSLEAKVTYTFLLNRFQLSKLNGWLNGDGEVFIIYTRISLAEELQISYRKVIAAMMELTAARLIYERRCGRGDANQIYLARVELSEERQAAYESAPFVSEKSRCADLALLDDGGDDEGDSGDWDRGGSDDNVGEDDNICGKADVNGDTGGAAAPVSEDAANQELLMRHFKNCKNGISRTAKTARQELPFPHSSNTYHSKNDKRYIERQSVASARARDRPADDDEIQELESILYDCDLWVFPENTAQVFENAIERLFFSERFRIGDAVLPQKKLRAHLHLLDAVKLQEAEAKLLSNRERRIRNSTAYVMAVIYNGIWETESDVLCDPYLNSLCGQKGRVYDCS
jgi:hypothetical protein